MLKKFLLVSILFVLVLPVLAQSTEELDLTPIKAYAAENAGQMLTATESFLITVQSYYDVVAQYEFNYELALADDAQTLIEFVLTARQNWLEASLYYELNEGIVAGTPSLAYYDVLIDAGASAQDDPDNALDWTLVLPDGTQLVSPGNLFHSLSEPALYGTVSDYIAIPADLDGDGEITFTEVLPDANFLLGVAVRLHEETQNLKKAIDEWIPTREDAFTALVVMIPTMSEYFGQWKESAFIVGENATESSFVATSRLFDIINILTGLRVTYETISPLIAPINPKLNAQIGVGFDDLQAYVGDLYADEQKGAFFDPEEVDLLGTEAQSRAEALVALVAQAADELGIVLDLN